MISALYVSPLLIETALILRNRIAVARRAVHCIYFFRCNAFDNWHSEPSFPTKNNTIYFNTFKLY